MPTYNARAYYTTDGVGRTFEVPFPYLAKTDVKVTLDSNPLVPDVDFTWISASEISITLLPAIGLVLSIIRVTPDAEMEVVFRGGALSPADLNEATLQLLFLSQENQDESTYLAAIIATLQGGGDDDSGGGGGSGPISSISLGIGKLYIDTNVDGEDRLVWDPKGIGSTAPSDIPNPGGRAHSIHLITDEVSYYNASGGRVDYSFRYADWSPSISLQKPTQKRSRFYVVINGSSGINAPLWNTDPQGIIPDGSWVPTYFPQEVGGMSITVTNEAGIVGGKIEGVVISARENPSILDVDGVTVLTPAYPSKGVAAQFITVRATRGPLVDDRTQFDSADDTNSDLPGTALGSYTVRFNAGTDAVGADAAFFRSWCASLTGGRAGYLNGHVLGKTKNRKDGSGVDQFDGDGIPGNGGCWGGRSFWHQDAFAVYARDDCPGYIWIGADGCFLDGGGNPTSAAPAAINIDTTGTVAPGVQSQVMFVNGVQLLSVRQPAIANSADATTNAILAALRTHGLIAT